MSDRAQQVIDQVEGGVARSIGELCEQAGFSLEDLTKEETDEIDEAIFTCDMCGWTMPREEESESADGNCRECEEEEDDD